jgi:hypothetical protein
VSTADEIRSSVASALADYRHARRRVGEEKALLAALARASKDARHGQRILQGVAQAVQETAHRQIARVVTRCLKVVFGPSAYAFRIRFEQRRGKTQARLLFARGSAELEPDQVGGGVIDVAAFALQVACLLLSTPRRRRLQVKDEPFKNVHGAANRRRCADLVLTLARELKIQFVIATGLDWMEIGKVVRVRSQPP